MFAVDASENSRRALRKAWNVAFNAAVTTQLIVAIAFLTRDFAENRFSTDLNFLLRMFWVSIVNVVLYCLLMPLISTVSAMVSHRMFYRSGLPVNYASAAIAIIAVLTLAGWAVLLQSILSYL